MCRAMLAVEHDEPLEAAYERIRHGALERGCDVDKVVVEILSGH